MTREGRREIRDMRAKGQIAPRPIRRAYKKLENSELDNPNRPVWQERITANMEHREPNYERQEMRKGFVAKRNPFAVRMWR